MFLIIKFLIHPDGHNVYYQNQSNGCWDTSHDKHQFHGTRGQSSLNMDLCTSFHWDISDWTTVAAQLTGKHNAARMAKNSSAVQLQS